MTAPMRGPTGKTGNIRPSGYNVGQLQQMTPEQMEFLQHLMGQLGPDSFLSKIIGGDESFWEQLEAPAMKQLGQMQGDLASRFSGAGMGARHGSGFQNAVGQQAADFAQNLQSQRLGLRMQALRDLMGMGNQLLQNRPYEQYLAPKQEKPNYLAQITGKVAGGIPGAIAGYASGGWGGAAQGFGSAF